MNEKFITIERVCEITGFSRNYIYQLTCYKQIPHYKPTGRKLLFKESDITKWIEQSRINAGSEQF